MNPYLLHRRQAFRQTGDPFWDDVVFLQNFQGADGSKPATDESQYAHTLTWNGDAVISTAQSHFAGGSSLALDGIGDFVDLIGATVFDLGTQDFTVESWARFVSVSSGCIISKHTTTIPHWLELRASSSRLLTQVSINGTTWGISFSSSSTISANTWYHVALVRSGATFTTYIDGVSVGTASNTGSVSDNIPYPLRLGVRGGNDLPINGFIGPTRVTKGVARYTANFTSPTAPFPTGP